MQELLKKAYPVTHVELQPHERIKYEKELTIVFRNKIKERKYPFAPVVINNRSEYLGCLTLFD